MLVFAILFCLPCSLIPVPSSGLSAIISPMHSLLCTFFLILLCYFHSGSILQNSLVLLYMPHDHDLVCTLPFGTHQGSAIHTVTELTYLLLLITVNCPTEVHTSTYNQYNGQYTYYCSHGLHIACYFIVCSFEEKDDYFKS